MFGWDVRSRGGSDNKKAPLLGLMPSTGGGGGIRTLVTLYRPNGFRDRRIQPLCHPSAWGVGLVPLICETRRSALLFLAERWGFEPQIPFWGIHDFQSCSFGQLGHLSVLPIAAAKYYT